MNGGRASLRPRPDSNGPPGAERAGTRRSPRTSPLRAGPDGRRAPAASSRPYSERVSREDSRRHLRTRGHQTPQHHERQRLVRERRSSSRPSKSPSTRSERSAAKQAPSGRPRAQRNFVPPSDQPRMASRCGTVTCTPTTSAVRWDWTSRTGWSARAWCTTTRSKRSSVSESRGISSPSHCRYPGAPPGKELGSVPPAQTH